MTKVAVLGSGKMGGAIARRLKKSGLEVSVWDRTKSKAEALGVGPVTDSPADATRNADVVISMLTGPQAVRDVYFGRGGVFEASSNKTIVDMSTTGPGTAQELAQGAETNGARLIEAPVIDSTPAVDSGSLFILAGAARVDDVEAVRPILEHLGEVHYVGDLGSAAALKLIAASRSGFRQARTRADHVRDARPSQGPRPGPRFLQVRGLGCCPAYIVDAPAGCGGGIGGARP